ncbi:MAG: tetratricopeptide repeat protein, partial [Gammaproteobacteria bacterium]
DALAVTPAERAIERAQTMVAARPDAAAAHTSLGMALARRARETADPAFYARGMDAVDEALTRAPDDFMALRARAWILLGQHEFAGARAAAEALHARAPDDLMTYALLVDACVELGDYVCAEEAAQWLLDLRPGNVAGLTRAAYLRELFGDLDGAVELMSQALNRMPPDETEERAWLLVQLAHLNRAMRRLDVAERALDAALVLFPDYHYALGELAQLRRAQGRRDDAVAAAARHLEAAPHPEVRFEYARLLHAAGRNADAEREFARFVNDAEAESTASDNANRELVIYLLEHAQAPRAALEIAEREARRRADVRTLDVHAWALHHNGRSAEAWQTVSRALAVGVRDPVILFHAGLIAAAVGEDAPARQHLRDALAMAPWLDHATAARRHLARLGEAARPAS